MRGKYKRTPKTREEIGDRKFEQAVAFFEVECSDDSCDQCHCRSECEDFFNDYIAERTRDEDYFKTIKLYLKWIKYHKQLILEFRKSLENTEDVL